MNNVKKCTEIMNNSKNELNSEIILIFHHCPNGDLIALLLISSFFFCEQRSVLSLSLSLTVARLTVTLRSVCDWIWWTFGPLIWAFFILKEKKPNKKWGEVMLRMSGT